MFFSILRPTNCVFGHILTFSTPKLCIWHTYDSPFQKRRTNEIHAFLVCFAYMTLGMSSYEKFFRKFFFQKVHFILNIFIYYGIFISLILLELSYIENSLQNSFFGLKSLENLTFRDRKKDSRKSNECFISFLTSMTFFSRIQQIHCLLRVLKNNGNRNELFAEERTSKKTWNHVFVSYGKSKRHEFNLLAS